MTATTNDDADSLFELARTAHHDGRADDAILLYRRVIELEPEWAAPRYNLGLIYKQGKAWQLSLEQNAAATQLDPDDEATNWNLAIAATALGDWETARAAWQRAGVTIKPGTGPIDEDFGMTPVRLNLDDSGEVVWGQRIDPARVRIENIPYPGSGFRYQDVVLHDGAPNGERERNGRTYYVFDVLDLFERSAFSTFAITVDVNDDADISALDDICSRHGMAMEDWTRNVRQLCQACSQGRPDEAHNHQSDAEARHVGIAARSRADVERALDAWRSGSRTVVAVQEDDID